MDGQTCRGRARHPAGAGLAFGSQKLPIFSPPAIQKDCVDNYRRTAAASGAQASDVRLA